MGYPAKKPDSGRDSAGGAGSLPNIKALRDATFIMTSPPILSCQLRVERSFHKFRFVAASPLHVSGRRISTPLRLSLLIQRFLPWQPPYCRDHANDVTFIQVFDLLVRYPELVQNLNGIWPIAIRRRSELYPESGRTSPACRPFSSAPNPRPATGERRCGAR